MDRLIDWMKNTALLLIVFIAFAVVAEILLLYFLKRPVHWVSELTEYALVYITFLSAVWILKEDGHVRVDFLLKLFPPKVQALLEVFVSFIGLLVSGIICTFGFLVIQDLSKKGLHTETILAVPKAALYAIIPFGFLLLFLQFVKRVWYWVQKWKESVEKEKQFTDM